MITSRDLGKYNVYQQISVFLEPRGSHLFWKGSFTKDHKPIAEVLYKGKFSDVNPIKILWCYKYWKYPHKDDIFIRRKFCKFYNCVNPDCYKIIELGVLNESS